MDGTERARIQRINGDRIESLDDTLVVEQDVVIEVDGDILLRTTCSPGQLREWVLGYLLSEGRISTPEDVAAIHDDDGVLSVELGASAPAEPRPLAPVASDLAVDRTLILKLAEETVERAVTFRETGGTHAMAIASFSAIVAFAEDISRTCALEKALGLALKAKADFSQSIAFLSSRVPSRMIAKLVRCGVPIVAAVSAPTADAVRLAEELSICLCGFVRGNRMNVYAHEWRVHLAKRRQRLT
jgi:FdhD protein